MSRATDEGLARLEHKLDIILELFMRLSKTAALPQVGDGSHSCPVCRQTVKYIIDPQERSVARQCGCKTGKFAPLDLEQFAPPKAQGGNHGTAAEGYRDSASDGDTERSGRGGSQGPRRG